MNFDEWMCLFLYHLNMFYKSTYCICYLWQSHISEGQRGGELKVEGQRAKGFSSCVYHFKILNMIAAQSTRLLLTFHYLQLCCVAAWKSGKLTVFRWSHCHPEWNWDLANKEEEKNARQVPANVTIMWQLHPLYIFYPYKIFYLSIANKISFIMNLSQISIPFTKKVLFHIYFFFSHILLCQLLSLIHNWYQIFGQARRLPSWVLLL